MAKAQLLAEIRQRMESACRLAQRSPTAVQLIGVSKTKPATDIVEFLDLGLEHFGENYLQEALPKISELNSMSSGGKRKPIWHFIGQLQSNKARQIPGNFHWLHSLDSLSSAKKLSAAAQEQKLVQKCLIQINIDNEATKGGVSSLELPKFLESLVPLSGIQVHGLMCIPNPALNRDVRVAFSALRKLMEDVNRANCYSSPLRELSMGMSEDFESAIAEGSTFIRVGTALFGERSK